MMAKIEWYQEVLALEPGSKVFFPYARGLAEAGQREEALRVLHHGLSLHPEFLEARVFLVALLHEAGEVEACTAELVRVEKLFASYPGFWDAWSQRARSSGDNALALGAGFCASSFRNAPISLDDVVLRSLNGEGSAPMAPLPLLTGQAVPASSEASRSEAPRPEPVMTKPTSSGPSSAGRTAPGIELPAPFDDEGDEEALSLRTRSMADVLAEQGDLQEAVDIYRELAASESDSAERKSLNKRLKQLEKMLNSTEVTSQQKGVREEPVMGQVAHETTGQAPVTAASPAAAEPATATETEAGTADAANLRSVLENLAGRLEARARA